VWVGGREGGGVFLSYFGATFAAVETLLFGRDAAAPCHKDEASS
jgi:hypothetical protein